MISAGLKGPMERSDAHVSAGGGDARSGGRRAGGRHARSSDSSRGFHRTADHGQLAGLLHRRGGGDWVIGWGFLEASIERGFCGGPFWRDEGLRGDGGFFVGGAPLFM